MSISTLSPKPELSVLCCDCAESARCINELFLKARVRDCDGHVALLKPDERCSGLEVEFACFARWLADTVLV